jgi:2,5-diamino-6-(ribosylamino)-4(3H)-pyrimidinone 5'-phosphate reductase
LLNILRESVSEVEMRNVLPRVVIHNSVSLDGSLTGFEPNMTVHYQIAGNYKPQVHLIGSNTARVGVELFGNGVPAEEDKDFEKPIRDKYLPYWIIPDTKGILKGLLHACRQFEYCRDVAVLVSEKTPREYVEYLEERNYAYFVVGKNCVDLRQALELIYDRFKAKRILTDTGRILGNLLLEGDLVDEISLLVHPVIVGEKSYNMFGNMRQSPKLKLNKQAKLGKGLIWLVYKVVNEKAEFSKEG